jgi:hypothetical protein
MVNATNGAESAPPDSGPAARGTLTALVLKLTIFNDPSCWHTCRFGQWRWAELSNKSVPFSDESKHGCCALPGKKSGLLFFVWRRPHGQRLAKNLLSNDGLSQVALSE